MEGFEHVVRLYLERQGFVVATNVKFKISKKTQKKEHDETQSHGYEVDVVAARADQLLLGEVKSFFGSTGVQRSSFVGLASTPTNATEKWLARQKAEFARYRLLNDAEHRAKVIEAACEKYGYADAQVKVALFVGHFKPGDEADITSHLQSISVGSGTIEVHGPKQIAGVILKNVLADKTYADDPVVSTLRLLQEIGAVLGAPTAKKARRAKPSK